MHWQRERDYSSNNNNNNNDDLPFSTLFVTKWLQKVIELLNKFNCSYTLAACDDHVHPLPLARRIFPVSRFFAIAFIHSTHTLRVRLLASMQQKQQQKPTTSTHKHKSACKTVCMHVHTRSIECGQISLLRAAFLKTFFDVNVSGRRSRWAVLRACTCYIRLLFGKVNLTSFFFQVNNIWKQCI